MKRFFAIWLKCGLASAVLLITIQLLVTYLVNGILMPWDIWLKLVAIIGLPAGFIYAWRHTNRPVTWSSSLVTGLLVVFAFAAVILLVADASIGLNGLLTVVIDGVVLGIGGYLGSKL